MFESDEKIQSIKDVLSTRKNYHNIITNHDFTDSEKDILLRASANINHSKVDKLLINQAYDILISKSIIQTTLSTPKSNKSPMNLSLLKYLLIGAFLFMLFYLTNFEEQKKEEIPQQEVPIVKLGDISGQGFLRTKGGSVRTCAGNSVYIEKSNPNGFIIQSEVLQEKKRNLTYFESKLRSEKYSLGYDEKRLKDYNSEISSNQASIIKKMYKGMAADKKVEISESKKTISKLEKYVLDWNKEVLNQQTIVDNSIKDNIQKTMCDAQGNYEFKKVEVGKYYITTVVEWYVGEDKQGGIVSKIINVNKGKNKIMITE